MESKIYLEEMQEDVPEFGKEEKEEDADVLLQDKDFDHAQQVPPNNYDRTDVKEPEVEHELEREVESREQG